MLSIDAWTAVSPYGLGRRAFVEGIRSGTRPGGAAEVRVPDFEPRELLGRKGTRSMDRVTAMALVAVGDLFAGSRPADPERTAVALATAGAMQGMYDFTRGSLLAAKPYHVDPAVIPNGLMNCAASRTAIWHGLRGPNVTIASGRVGALQALATAGRLVRTGRARRVVVGAVEESSAVRTAVEHASGRPPGPQGEGCVLFLVGPLGGGVEVLGVRSRVFEQDDPASGVRECLRDVLAACRTDPREVGVALLSRPHGVLGDQEADAVASVLGPAAVAGAPDLAPLGETAAVTGAFHIAAYLATAPRAGQLTAVVSVDPGGGVACALLRGPVSAWGG